MMQVIQTIKIQLLLFFRIKQAVFFSFAFPCFIFILFGKIFGTNENYTYFIFTGVIGMNLMSSGFYSVGAVLMEYYQNGWLKYLKHLKIKPINFFIGLIISKLITFYLLLLCLAILMWGIFDRIILFDEWMRIIGASSIGFICFSFIGLCLSFSSLRYKSQYNLTTVAYYVLLFTSSAFYPICEFNELFCKIGNSLPLNGILNIMRNGTFSLTSIYWTVVSVLLFLFLLEKLKYKR